MRPWRRRGTHWLWTKTTPAPTLWPGAYTPDGRNGTGAAGLPGSAPPESRDRETWYFSGRAYYDANRFENAIECYQRALSLGAAQSRVYENLGLASEALGRFAAAEQAYRRALELSTGDFRPYLVYGVFLEKQGKSAEGVAMIEKALSLDPENVDTHFELGKALNQSGQLAAAARVLEAALARSNQCRIHYPLVTIYARLGRAEDADRRAKAIENCRNEP